MTDSQKHEPQIQKLYRLQSIHDLCKLMISQSRSLELLTQYYDNSTIRNYNRINSKTRKQWRYYQGFAISHMISMKGNKKHQNLDLKRFITLKLYSSKQIDTQARKSLWVQFTDIKQNKGMYNTIKKYTNSQKYFDEIITKDLNRTVGSENDIEMTRNVLVTIAKYNPFVGYCQGFNNIIMFLIEQGFTEQETFFIWKYISLQLLPIDYYTNMISVLSDIDIIFSIYIIQNPKCTDSIAANKEKLTSLMLPWLICLFTREPIQEQLTRMFWDFILVEGLIAVYKAVLALLKYVQGIIQITGDQQIIKKSEQKIKKIQHPSDCLQIKKIMQQIYINPKILTLCRTLICSRYQQKQKDIVLKKQPSVKQCNPSSHICIQQLQNNRFNFQNRSFECQIFRVKNPINIIENYLDQIEKKDFCQKKKGDREEDLIIIGRINHVCNDFKGKENEKREKGCNNENQKDKQRDKQNKLFHGGMQRTESMVFFQHLLQNPSFSNLFANEEIWEHRISPFEFVNPKDINMLKKSPASGMLFQGRVEEIKL